MIEIDGVIYTSATEVAEKIGVTRQTLWRWRSEGKIPQGHRFRDRQVLFTESEVASVRRFAFRIQPIKTDEDCHDQSVLRR